MVAAACSSYVVVISMLCYQVVTFNNWLPTNNSHLFELLQDLSMDALNIDNKSDLLSLLKNAPENLANMGFLNDDEDESDAGDSSPTPPDLNDLC